MSKKRVHEIAKELKGHGIELDNKEVVTELVSLGYDVKSHSSSLEDDQAIAAVQKILDKRKPKAAPPPVAAKGFLVRRKPGVPASPAEGQAPAEAPPQYAAPPQVEEAPVQPPVDQTPPPPEPVETAPVAAAPEQPATEPLKTPEPPPAAVAPPPVVQQPAAAAPPAQPGPAAAPPPLRSPQAGTRPGFVPAQIISRPAPQVSRPYQPPPPRHGSAQPQRPAVAVPPTVRPSGTGHHAQPPVQAQGGQPGATATGPQTPAANAPPAAPPVDPRTLKPTATQAVVISRPLIAVRRVTPASTAHKNIPMAPGRKAIGEVREFKVVPDHLGRGGREFVDVSKNKDQRPKKRSDGAKEGGFDKQAMTDAIWGRIPLAVRGKKKRPTKKGAKTQITEMAEEKKVIKLQDGISVSDLGQRMGVKTAEIIKKLMAGGKMVTSNQIIDVDTAGIIAADHGWKVEKVGFEVEDHLPEVEDKPEDVKPRPPVVTVMGHVDHGKTSLLDAIRKANVAAGESGGITQHIGAYSVKTSRGDITFLDTPGHEAFTSMRARGADVTDIVVLVVAADDSVMPQTVEAINHAKAAEVPVIVAINKIDVPGANPDRVKKDLADKNLLAEDWGGDVLMVPVSAKTKAGIDSLLENIALQAEILELTANPNKPAVGHIIEAKLDKGRGPVATVLVQEGTLRAGDSIVTGTHSGKVRALTDDKGKSVKEVKPGFCAEVIGLDGVPSAGDPINMVADEKAAKEIAQHRAMKERQAEIGKTSKDTLEALFTKMKQGEQKELRVVLKADVQGSLEAVAQAVQKLSTPKVKTQIIHKGVGQMTETDVMMAAASKGMVIGFNVRPESGAEATAKKQEVTLQTYSIIYELIDGVRTGMEGLLEPIRTERKLGRAEVLNTFNVPKLGTIAGVSVKDGVIKRSALVRMLRENKPVFTGKIASLRRFKDDVKEVAQGFECGIGIENFSDMKVGDVIEAYEIEETRPSLS